jgi:beta-glucosidase
VKVEFACDNRGGAAEKLAKACDMAVVCVGNHPLGNGGWGKRDSKAEGKESLDRESMELRQEDLVRKVVSANPRTVVVIQSSFPLTMEWTAKHAPAIVHLTHSGQEMGTALAGALFGDFNPGGRLVQTWPKTMRQLPPMMDYDLRHGRTYMYFKGEPQYPFGFGLSYTAFRYSNLRFDTPKMGPEGKISVLMDITNQGDRVGDEVAQLYVRFKDSRVSRPNLALKAFKRLALQPGETKTVVLFLRAKDLAAWDEKSQSWMVETCRVQVCVGASSADLRLKDEIEVVGPPEISQH